MEATDKHDIHAVVLAGGTSGRFGSDKRFAPIGGTTMLQHVVALLSSVFPQVTVVTEPHPSLNITGADIVWDTFPRKGPLAGIHAALSKTVSQHIMVAACDMPLISMSLVRHIVSLRAEHRAVAPMVAGRPEPLLAVYSIDCLPELEMILDSGGGPVRSLLEAVSAHYVEEEELRRFDPDLQSFFNVNTPEELEEASRRLAVDSN
jgi:molybdopterin-guanine dinucleotide biosynthesis protein A